VTFDLKVVSESRVTWATSVSILVFLGPSVLDLGLMHATDRRQTASSLYAPRLLGVGHNNKVPRQLYVLFEHINDYYISATSANLTL